LLSTDDNDRNAADLAGTTIVANADTNKSTKAISLPPAAATASTATTAAGVACAPVALLPNNTAIDVIILAPPWGGPEYLYTKEFDMKTMFPSGDGMELVSKCDVLMYDFNVCM
jgi:hypothetical protein